MCVPHRLREPKHSSTQERLFFNNNFPEIYTGFLQLLTAMGVGVWDNSRTPPHHSGGAGFFDTGVCIPDLTMLTATATSERRSYRRHKGFLKGFHSIY